MMDVLQKMTASRICRLISVSVEEIADIITDIRITQVKADPSTLTTHLKSRPVQWKHVSENLEMTVAAVERHTASIKQHPLSIKSNSSTVPDNFRPRLMNI